MIKIILVLVFFALAGATFAEVSAYMPKASGDSDTSFSEAVDAASNAFAVVEKFEIYEGWPRTTVNVGNILASQPQDEPPLKIDGELFYPQARTPAADDAQALRHLLGSKLFRPWHGVKFCGGFHADFAIRFELEGNIYSILLCFGCHEARLVRGQSTSGAKQRKADFRLTTDLAPELFNKLKALLLKYRKHDLVRS